MVNDSRIENEWKDILLYIESPGCQVSEKLCRGPRAEAGEQVSGTSGRAELNLTGSCVQPPQLPSVQAGTSLCTQSRSAVWQTHLISTLWSSCQTHSVSMDKIIATLVELANSNHCHLHPQHSYPGVQGRNATTFCQRVNTISKALNSLKR